MFPVYVLIGVTLIGAAICSILSMIERIIKLEDKLEQLFEFLNVEYVPAQEMTSGSFVRKKRK